MTPPFIRRNIFGLNFFSAVLVLTILFLASGCDTKQGVKIGDTAPGFSGTDINGEFVSLSQAKGKVVVLYFWTNSCCGGRLKLLEPYYVKNKDKGLTILAINVGDTKETVESYVRSNALTFSFQADEHRMISNQYGVFGFPTIFVLDRRGVIREKILGSIPSEKLEKLVSGCLNIKPQQ
jgi:peroxiredoxin